MLAKIIKIENGIVNIVTDKNEIKEINQMSLNFQPKIGDIVEIYGDSYNQTVTLANQYSNPVSNRNVATVSGNLYSYNSNRYDSSKPVNKVTYCLLALFLGFIGMHKFYAGKKVMGALYLLFCWSGIPAVISLIEFFITILFKTADEYGNIKI